LNEEDKTKYLELRTRLSFSQPNLRNGGISLFVKLLNTIRQYTIRGEPDDPIRCATCGICWLPDGIAYCAGQLSLLIGKCKSSINGSLQKIGYSSQLVRGEGTMTLALYLPFLKDHPIEHRKWTVRKVINRFFLSLSTPPPTEPKEMVKPKLESIEELFTNAKELRFPATSEWQFDPSKWI
jgi:hypothetical protein